MEGEWDLIDVWENCFSSCASFQDLAYSMREAFRAHQIHGEEGDGWERMELNKNEITE